MQKITFNHDWLFALENTLDVFNGFGFDKYADAIGAPARYYDHANWTKVTLPHDWAVSLDRDPKANTFAGAYPNTRSHRFMTERRCEAEQVFPVGWYRKSFTSSPDWNGKRVFLEFEGVFRDAMVWVNGVYLDRHTSGYTSFWLEITDHLVFGESNSIAVRVDSSQAEGWWYEGAGIYRNVFLHVAQPVYLKPWQTIVRTEMDGTVHAECLIVNDTAEPFAGEVCFSIPGEDRAVVSAEVPPFSEMRVEAVLNIAQPRLWHVEDPHLYTLTIRIGEETHTETFGVRTVAFDPDHGFLLNGKPLKIRGACVHQDFGGVGVALTDNLQFYKIQKLKEMGVNAYRCSHHAPSPALLRACDELGMLVMDETRLFGTSPEAIRQLTSVIERDRNHPCVFIWSLGNEEFSVQNDAWSARLMQKMTRIAKQLDPTRPVTYSGNNGPDFTGANSVSEVRGVNYIRNDGNLGGLWLDQYHADHPHQPIIGTEEGSYVLSRGGTKNDLENRLLDASGLVTMPWGSTPKGWVKYFEERPFLAGSFLWTGFDYRGEPNPFVTANAASAFGTIDLCGMEKPPFWYYQAWWTDQPVLRLAPHWAFAPGDPAQICVFTNCEEVTLFLNGRKLETQPVRPFDAPVFRVPFEPGVLMAEGIRNGQILRSVLRTPGKTNGLRVLPVLEAANGDDIAIYQLEAVDPEGLLCPNDQSLAEISVENGVIVGVGNGDPACFDREQPPAQEEAVLLHTFQCGDQAYTVPPKAENHLRKRFDWLEDEPAGNGFEDDRRIIARFADDIHPTRTVTLTARISGVEQYEYLEFERLGGDARVFLNGVEIGSNIDRAGRIPISHARPYRFVCRFREGENEIRIVSVQRTHSDPPVSGTVKIGRTLAPVRMQVRLHYGLARVFVRSETPSQLRVTASIV